MLVSCYTVRPGPDSGWITFFELARSGATQGFFLILGPQSPPDADQRRAAQEAARRVVTGFKMLRDPRPLECLNLVESALAECRVRMEYGVAVFRRDGVSCLTTGRVRFLALTASAQRRWPGNQPPGLPATGTVEPGDRFFLGRVPREYAAGAGPAAIEGLERTATGDGALVLTLHGGEAQPAPGEVYSSLAGVAAPEPPVAVAPAEVESPAAPAPSAIETPAAPIAEAPPPPVQEAAAETPPPPSPPPAVEAPPPPEATGKPAAPAAEAAGEGVFVPAEWMSTVGGGEDKGRGEMPSWRAARRRNRLVGWLLFAMSAAVLAGYVLFVRPAVRRTPPPAAPAAAAPESSGVAPAAPAPGPGTVWSVRLPGAITVTPVLAGDRLVFGCRDGRIYGLKLADGTVAWSVATPKGIGAGALRVDSLVCVAGFDGVARMLRPETGQMVWQFATGGRITASPRLTTEGRVLIASYDHALYALEATTGRLAWKTRLSGILWAPPAVGVKYVYAPGLDGVVTAVNSKWGSVAWRARIGGEIYSAPAATDSLVVVGCSDGSVYALAADTGRILWKAAVGAPVDGGVVRAGNRYLVGDDAGVLHALNAADGREAWRYASGGPIKSTPVVDPEGVIVSSHDGFLHAVGLADGAPLGRIPFEAPMAAAPLVAGDSLVVGTHSGTVALVRLR